MHDIEDRIRRWTDHASSGAEPVSVDEALARSTAPAGGRRSAPGAWRRRGPVLAAAALLAVVTAAAVALAVGGGDVTQVATEGFDDEDVVAPEPVDGPYDETAVMRPDVMQLDPAEAYPGDVVELHFPEERLRGMAYVLEEAVEGSWVLRYYLTAGLANESWDGYWSPAGAPHVWDDIGGIMGTGPDRITVPDTATPGEYRVCTAKAVENICTPLRILAVEGSADGYRDFDELLVEVADEVPQFGGFFFGGDGETINVWLTGPATASVDADRAMRVHRELRRRFPDQVTEGLRIEVLRATYGWHELHRWFGALFMHLDEPGVVFIDIDDRENRLLVGVSDLDRNGPGVRSRALALGVPEAALNLVESGELVDD